jgi:uncharacterized membrane protein
VTYAVAVPKQGEAFTEFYLLTEDDDEELVADNYPTDFRVGESQPVVLGVTNNENEQQEYTIVAELHRVQREQNRTTVVSETELQQFNTPTLQNNQSWQQTHQITPTMTGTRLRLAYLLYRGAPPDDPTIENAYREVHLWINVSSR